MRDENRMNSQEWSIQFEREREATRPRQEADVLDGAIRALAAGDVDPSDPRLLELRRLLEHIPAQRQE